MIGGAIYSLLPDRFAYERGVFPDGEKLDSQHYFELAFLAPSIDADHRI